MQLTEETYLGDGLYVSVQDGAIRLRAPRCDGIENHVYLDAQTLEAFLTWLKALRERVMEESRQKRPLCEECSIYLAVPHDKLCVGCRAYKYHTGH